MDLGLGGSSVDKGGLGCGVDMGLDGSVDLGSGCGGGREGIF